MSTWTIVWSGFIWQVHGLHHCTFMVSVTIEDSDFGKILIYIYIYDDLCAVVHLCSTPPRVYRQVASLMGLSLVTSYITIANMLGVQRETTRRQLDAEKKKLTEGPRMESLNKRFSEMHEKITLLEEMMRKIFTG